MGEMYSRVQALEKENERLREALQQLRRGTNWGRYTCGAWALGIINSALERESQ
jgi:hypothetical protein